MLKRLLVQNRHFRYPYAVLKIRGDEGALHSQQKIAPGLVLCNDLEGKLACLRDAGRLLDKVELTLPRTLNCRLCGPEQMQVNVGATRLHVSVHPCTAILDSAAA